MRTFYTASDIEDLAAGGVSRLELASGVVLTAAAKDRAEELGLTLVAPGSAAAGKSAGSAPAAKSAVAVQSGAAKGSGLPAKPRGCQHDLPGPAASQGAANPVVQQLVDAVSALKKKGA